jgi:ATP-binding cassette, subfamily F, member 3
MLLTADISGKTLGNKELFRDLRITLQDKERVAIIGRNGVGKTTLFRILTGEDSQYQGSIQTRRGLVLVATAQEHHLPEEVTPVSYVLSELPEYTPLKHILDSYPEHMGDDMKKIHEYSDALTRFTELGYYEVEDRVVQTLAAYQIPQDLAYGPMMRLSGGQKRFVELAKVTQSKADLALIDEPTNHMDYMAKQQFIEWFRTASESVCVISHDRDVLNYVDRIIEVKEMRAISYPGNYDNYLKQNSVATITAMAQYEVAQRTLEKLHEQIQEVRAKKAGSSKTPNPFIPMERRLTKEYDDLKARSVKPSFWIDQESMDQLQDKVVDRYDKYKAKNIRISTGGSGGKYHQLLGLSDLSLGYGNTLFTGVTAQLRYGDRLQIRGRNGAGKTTLVRQVLAAAGMGESKAQLLSGSIDIDRTTRIGLYEQEIAESYLSMTLGEAVVEVFRVHGLPINDQRVRQTLSTYLFDPNADYLLPISVLSGGQKARFQLINMLSGEPNLLILDEPTNHLDLPSIEELEKSLTSYRGAILYISHDSYFADKLGGETLQIGPV